MELKSREQDDCAVSGAIAIALRISRVAGFAPLHFERISSGSFRVSTSSAAAVLGGLTLTMLRLSTFAILLTDLTLDEITKSLALDSKSSILLFFADVVLTVSATSLGIYFGTRRMKRFFYILTLLQEVNAKTAYDDSFEPRPWKVWVSFLSAIFSGYGMILFNLVIFIVRNRGTKSMGLIFMYSFYFENGLVVFLIMQNAFLILSVYSTTRALNTSLRRQLNKISRCIMDKKLVQYFLSICEILQLINQSEGVIFILLICGMILYIFVSVYYLALNLLFSDISLESILQVIGQSLWLIWHITKMLIMVEPCHQLHQEMETTKHLLCQLLCQNQQRLVHRNRRDMESDLSILFLDVPPFCPLGLVTFGRPLLATIAGAVSTFFLIVIEFNFKAV